MSQGNLLNLRLLRRIHSRHPFVILCSWVFCIGVPTCLLLDVVSPVTSLSIAAVMMGFCEINGRCGASHVGTILPLRVLSPRLWSGVAAAYTSGGVMTAVLAGGAVGFLGELIPTMTDHPDTYVWVACGLLVMREMGWLDMPLPTSQWQTFKVWAFQHGLISGAAMWGAHLGLTYVTVIRHGGVFLLTMMALQLGLPSAVSLLCMYWLGRTLPIWALVLIADDQTIRDGEALSKLATTPNSERALSRLSAISMLLASVAFSRAV